MKKEYTLTEKYNLLKNNFVLGLTIYTFIISAALVGGLITAIAGAYYLQNYLPLNFDYAYLYLKSFLTFNDYINFNGKELLVDTVQYKIAPHFQKALTYYTLFFIVGAAFFGAITFYITNKFSNRAAEKLKDHHIRGTNIITEEELAKQQKERKVDGYNITPQIKIDREHETKHLLIVGGTGAGKTVELKRLIRAQMQHPKNSAAKFIIHDVKGDWVRQLYNKETDYIYNMSDKRSIYFNIFNYIKDINDLDSIVSTIIPNSPEEKEPIWTDSAKGILKGILIYCMATNQKSLAQVKKMITWKPNKLKKELSKIKGAEIAVQYLSASETQVANYMSNFVSRVKFFEALSDTCHLNKDNFDLEKWLKSDKQSKIFMVNNVKDMELNAPRIAVFVDSLIKIVLDFEENRDRRIYLYLDELGAAAKISSLEKGIILGRSYGLSVIVGIQEVAKFDKIYGQEDRKTIINNLSSKIVLRLQDAETAKYLADTIGEKEIAETDSSHSIGTEANRDGIGFSKKVKKEMAILPSQIMDLNDLEFYFKQPEQMWTHVQAEFVPEIDILENKNEAYIKCDGLGFDFEKTDNTVDTKISEEDLKNEEDFDFEEKDIYDKRRICFGKSE